MAFCRKRVRDMQENFTYHIKVQGALDEVTFNPSSPLQVQVMRINTENTTFTVHTDQSGLVGLVRHLHHQGYVLLSLSRQSNEVL